MAGRLVHLAPPSRPSPTPPRRFSSGRAWPVHTCERQRRSTLSGDRPGRLSYRRAEALVREASGGWTLH
jgi:hypothetical protein